MPGRTGRFLLVLSWFLAVWPAQGQPVFLNEAVSSNTSGLEDEDGDRPDWIELHNPGSAAINLAGFGLSDDPGAPFKWRFPLRILAARGFLVVFASGKDRTNRTQLHTSFRLASEGETVQLTRPDSRVSDRLVLPRLPQEIAFGRQPDASTNLLFLSLPSPSAANRSAAGSAVLRVPVFSATAGLHPEPFDLLLAPQDEGAVIRYTLDGSEPNEHSAVYATPLRIVDRSSEPDTISIISGTSTNNQHTDGWKPPRRRVRKATVVRARAFRPGALPSPIVTQSFLIGSHPSLSLPLLSLALAPGELFDFDRGIYVLGKVFADWRTAHPREPLTGHTPANYTQRGRDWARTASLEYFDAQGWLAFARNVKLDIQGQSSRSFRQKSLGVKGVSKPIDFEIFPQARRRGDGSPLRTFEHLRLRNSGNDWAHTLFRDALCHRLVDGLPLDAQFYRPAVVFLNGEYWGVHNIREQQDAAYLSAHYGMPSANVVICSGPGTLDEGPQGANTPYLALREFMRTNDLSIARNYALVEQSIDLDNFMLYHAANIYFGNADWPHNNIRFWRNSAGAPAGAATPGLDNRWRWLLFDCDLTFGHPWSGGVSDETLAAAVAANGRPGLGEAGAWSTLMLRALLHNPGFKHRFVNTAADLLNSWFRENRTAASIEEMAGTLAPAMTEHLDRWQTLPSINEWGAQVRVLRQFASQRPAILRQHFVTQFALAGYATLAVDVSGTNQGRVRLNRLLIDPRLPGVSANPYPWRGWYFRGIPVDLEAIPHWGWEFDRWELPSDEDTARSRLSRISWTPREPAMFTAHFKPLRPRFESIIAAGSDRFAAVVRGVASRRYRIETSRDLQFWLADRVITLDISGQARLELVGGGEHLKFFRILED